jgi:hypothetical protein
MTPKSNPPLILGDVPRLRGGGVTKQNFPISNYFSLFPYFILISLICQIPVCYARILNSLQRFRSFLTMFYWQIE